MRSTRQQARFAGRLYLLMCFTAPVGLLIVPAKLFVRGDAAATADHLRTGATLMRIGIASELFHQVVFLYLGFALYRLLEKVNKHLAVEMVTLVCLSVPIVFLNGVSELGALILAGGAPFLSAFTRPQLDSLAYFFLRLHGQGIGVAEVFWSLWLVPFALLVMRSGFLPKILGVFLLIAALGDLLTAVTILFPAPYTAILEPVAGIMALGEFPILLWLLIRGAREDEHRAIPAVTGGAQVT